MHAETQKARLAELEAEKATLLSQKDTPSTIPNVAVHPNLAVVYHQKVEELEYLLEDSGIRMRR